MSAYADTSFLVSCYLTDNHTPQARAYLSASGAPLPFTALHALEVRNACQLGIFRGLFTSAQAQAAWANLTTDLRDGRLFHASVNWPVAFRVAATLSEQHSSALGTRSLDILHIVAAQSLRMQDFASFDLRQSSLATAVGLKVVP